MSYIFKLLEQVVVFDTKVARDIMTERHGVAIRFMYQLYIELNKKRKVHISTTTVQPAKQQVSPRETELTLEAGIHTGMQSAVFHKHFLEQEQIRDERKKNRQELLDQAREFKAKQTELIAKIQSGTIHIPRPPPSYTSSAGYARREQWIKREAQNVKDAIERFEIKMKSVLPPSKLDDRQSGTFDTALLITKEADRIEILPIDLVKPSANDDYVGKIRKRLNEDFSAREEREKRRRKVLVDQLKAHKNQEDAHKEEMMVNRLMRQSQQERRIAVQLLQARHEKEVIRHNRIVTEKHFEDRRLKEFDDALDLEGEMSKLAKEECAEQIQQDKGRHNDIAAEIAEARYKKHYDSCSSIVDLIISFVCKVTEYREISNSLIPEKLMQEWQTLFVAGIPLFDPQPVESEEPTPAQLLEEERQQLLNEGDFSEYRSMVGEWQPPDGSDIQGPPPDNTVLGHVIQRLFGVVYPPSPPPRPQDFPLFPIHACVLGKVYSGKSTCIAQIVQEHRVKVLIVDDLLHQAIEAHKDGELNIPATEEEKIKSIDQLPTAANSSVSAPEAVGIVPKDKPAHGGSSTTKPVSKPNISKHNTDKPEPSVRAKLGYKALRFLKRGKAVDDQLMVDILIEAMRHIPEGTGWIIDDFPQTYVQAKLLEKALSGFDSASKSKDRKHRKSSMMPEARLSHTEQVSGIDVIIQFDIEDDHCMKRCFGQDYNVKVEEPQDMLVKLEPEVGSSVVPSQENLSSIDEETKAKEEMQQRITHFNDAWPKMEKWFLRFGTLKKIDANLPQEAVMLEVEKILEDAISKILGKDQDSSVPTGDIDVEPELKTTEAQDGGPDAELSREELHKDDPKSRASSKGSNPALSKKSGSRASSKDKNKSTSPRRSPTPKKSESKKSRRGSTPKFSSPRQSRKDLEIPEAEIQAEDDVLADAHPALQPGSEEWEYADQDLNKDLAEALVKYWEIVEKSYTENNKHVFHNIREEREKIYRYFYQIRQDYLTFLKNPDHKQDVVEDWHKQYNDVNDDLRDDVEVKAELHQSVDNLRERLWNICDNSKEQAEMERETIINNGWLEERLGLLSNHYVTLMQSEVDRFQDTLRMLKDYYREMDGQFLDELNNTYSGIPLIELSMDMEPECEEDNQQYTPQLPRISLVARQSIAIPCEIKDQATDTRESPVPPTDLDEKQIFDGAHNAAIVVTQIIKHELELKEQEEQSERQKEAEREDRKNELEMERKKAKKRKEVVNESHRPLQAVEQTDDEKKKKTVQDKMKQEYYFAIGLEDATCQSRVQLIKVLAISILQDLKGKGDNAYRDLNDWLGARYLKEMESIDQMSEVMRNHIEIGEKIKTELVLQKDDFLLDMDNVVLKSPSTPTKRDPIEQQMPDQFTVEQFLMLFQQFVSTAPSGVMSCQEFCDTLENLMAVMQGMDHLPDLWINILPAKIHAIGDNLSSSSDCVDWRRFLLPLTTPIQTPTQTDLLDTLARFRELDPNNTGFVSREVFEEVKLWFEESELEHEGCNRLGKLKKALFQVFSSTDQSPPLLDYTNMLMYFCAVPDGHEGFLRALNVAARYHMLPLETVNSVISDRKASIAESVGEPESESLDKVIVLDTPLKETSVESLDLRVPIQALYRTFYHGGSCHVVPHSGDADADAEDPTSMARLTAVYRELEENGQALPYRILIEHQLIQDNVMTCQNYKLLDLRGILANEDQEDAIENAKTLD